MVGVLTLLLASMFQLGSGERVALRKTYMERSIVGTSENEALLHEVYNPGVPFTYGLSPPSLDIAQLQDIKTKVHQLNIQLTKAKQMSSYLSNNAELLAAVALINRSLQILDSFSLDETGTLSPADKVAEWANEIIQSGGQGGLAGALTHLQAAMTGTTGGKPLPWTILDILVSQAPNPDSQVIWNILDSFLDFIASTQTAGYVVYAVALNTRGDSTGALTVQQIAAQSIAKQKHILAQLKDVSVRHWPSGTYGLVKPVGGCPAAEAGWQSGWRFQDTEDWKPDNRWSNGIHIAGDVEKNNVRWEFCIKTTAAGPVQWPRGTYCIFKKEVCPIGFQEGWVFWDDQDIHNVNENDGTLPDGVYDRNTLIYFCCRNDGSSLHPVSLPILRPFYLFAMQNAGCQEVAGMTSRDEWLWWDEENTRFTSSADAHWPHPKDTDVTGKNHKIHMCYYQRKQ